MTKFVAPSHGVGQFTCPHCHALAQQQWYRGMGVRFGTPPAGPNMDMSQVNFSHCLNCHRPAIWYDHRMILPGAPDVPPPNPDMPDDVCSDYLKARDVLDRVPEASAALMRRAIEKLCRRHLGQANARTLNEAIGNLVQQGLPVEVQQALDVVRVIGNDMIHPGLIDDPARDDRGTALSLFDLTNAIIRVTLSAAAERNRIAQAFSQLPQSAQDQVARRDSNP